MSPSGATIRYGFRRARAVRSTGIELRRGTSTDVDPEARPAREIGKVPRVTRLLALAHRFAEMLDRGEVASLAEVARAGRVTRARLSQIVDLTLLAPDIQEQVMNLQRVTSGRDPVTMRDLMGVLGSLYWQDQRARWATIRAGVPGDAGLVTPRRESVRRQG